MYPTTSVLMLIISMFSFGHLAPTTRSMDSVTCKPGCRIPYGHFVLSRTTYAFLEKFDTSNYTNAAAGDAIASFVSVHNQALKGSDAGALSLLYVAKSLGDHFCSKVKNTMEQDFSCSPAEWKKYKILHGILEETYKLMQNFNQSCSDSDCGTKCEWLNSIPHEFKFEVHEAASCRHN